MEFRVALHGLLHHIVLFAVIVLLMKFPLVVVLIDVDVSGVVGRSFADIADVAVESAEVTGLSEHGTDFLGNLMWCPAGGLL